jgi:hypothetical protein
VIRRLLPPLLVAWLAVAPRAHAADDLTASARSHYDMGVQQYDQRHFEEALIEFEAANALKSRPAALFMMAQCENLLGRPKEAQRHYEDYIAQSPDGEFVKLAKDRIESIKKIPSVLVINTVPDDVTVHIAPDGAPGPAVTGQAPNNFRVPHGRYRIDVTKPNYLGQTRIVDVDLGESRPLFFKLDPIPARLEIETAPPGATLYVNGNRARNPYRQDVVPGHYEVFVESPPEFTPRTLEFTLAPGDRKLLTGGTRLYLPYVQRSGRPELVIASAIIGGFVGAGAVAAAIGQDLDNPSVSSVALTTLGGIAGMVGGALIATPFVPRYIPDNRALFIIGNMWIGGAEGAGLGIVTKQIASHAQTPDPLSNPCPGPGLCRPPAGDQLRAAFTGSLPGLALGLTTGSLLRERAPTYGRVAMIQSAALGGAFTGALVQLATKWQPYGSGWAYVLQSPSSSSQDLSHCLADNSKCAFKDTTSNFLDLMPGALIGLNLGLAAGLLGAYLPNQKRYGPTWRRVLLIDLAAGAGALAGGVAGCVSNADDCLRSTNSSPDARALTASVALLGGGLGILGGVLLTRHLDDDSPASPAPPPVSVAASFAPIRGADGTTAPGLAAIGTF